MSKMCTVTRAAKYTENTPSEIYNVLRNITGETTLSTLLWGFSLLNPHLIKLKLPINRELTVEEFFKNEDYLYDLLETEEQRANFLNYVKKFSDTKYETHYNALQKAFSLLELYPEFSASIKYTNGGYTVTVVPKNPETQHSLELEQALSELNNKLISYLEKLGFAIKEVSGLSTPGIFAPKDATRNALDLIEVISIAKGKRGLKALPEEISHLLAAGMHKNPLMQRLKQILTLETIEEILGEQFELYKNKYEGNIDRLKEEVIGKLIAQNLVNRQGLSESIRYISNRVLDKIQGNLIEGNEKVVDEYLKETLEIIDSLTETIEKDENFLESLDIKNILSSDELYQIDNDVSELLKLADESYLLFAKKLKLESFKLGGLTARDDKEAFKQMEKNFEKARFYKGYTDFLKYVMNDCTSLYEDLQELKSEIQDESNLVKKAKLMTRAMRILVKMNSFINAYSDIIEKYTALSEVEGIQEELTETQIKTLEKTSSEIGIIIKKCKKLYETMRLTTLVEFFLKYWKKDIVINTEEGQSKMTLKNVLESLIGDTTGFDRLVNSIGDSMDPLLLLSYSAFQDLKYEMNKEAISFEQAIAQAEERYYEATGSRDTSFMYALGRDGKLNGMYISDIDYNAYYEAHRKKYEELKAKNLSKDTISIRMRLWRKQNTQSISIDITRGIKERVPKKSLYPSNDLALLNEAQLQYYNDIIAIKKQLRAMVPGMGSELYKAPLKKVSATDALLQKRNPKAYLRKLKEEYITTDAAEDEGFGELLRGERYVVLDFNLEEVKRVPTFYNKKLDDMSLLDTNTSDAMIAYANMAVNYKHMNLLADAMDLTSSLMNDRRVTQVHGAKKLFYKFKGVDDKTIKGDYVVLGKYTTLQKQLDYFIDANIYGRRKKVETLTWKNGNTTRDFNYGKLGDTAKTYSTLVGMGLNEFSSASNIAMGFIQIFREAVGKKYFGITDLAWAVKEYFKLRPANAVNTYSNNPKDLLTVMLKEFDCLNDLNRDLNSTTYDKGLFRRITNKFSLLIGNVLGEHCLRSIGMLATLHGHKVIYENKEVPLTNVLYVGEDSAKIGKSKKSNIEYTSYKLKISEGAKELNGQDISLFDLLLLIQEVNRTSLGGYSDADKGAIYETVLGRGVMQYRQWMPAMFSSRFGKEKINTRTGEIEKTDYRAAFAFLLGTLSDLKEFKFNLSSRYSLLSKSELANIRKVLFDAVLLLVLNIILPNKESGDDEEDTNIFGIKKYIDSADPLFVNKLKLVGVRAKLELSALFPSLGALQSNLKIIQLPIAAMENINNIFGLVDLSAMSEEVASGRYEGWSQWAKNLYLSIPGSRNVERFVDFLDGETDMFKPYLD